MTEIYSHPPSHNKPPHKPAKTACPQSVHNDYNGQKPKGTAFSFSEFARGPFPDYILFIGTANTRAPERAPTRQRLS